MAGPAKLFHLIRRKARAAVYSNPAYRLLLEQGPVPENLRLSLADPWPGDAEAGQALIASRADLFDDDNPTSSAKKQHLATHGFLRDLRAVGTDAARRKALTLLEDWLLRHDRWQEDSWAPDVLGERLANWILFFDFYSAGASLEFQACLLASMTRQMRHLLRVMPDTLTGPAHLRAIKGLVYAGLGLLEGNKALSLALDLLKRQLAAEILPDGGPISRNPCAQMDMLRNLIDIRASLRAAQMEVPHELTTAIERMVPALKLFRHGDGGLALFNGGSESSGLEMDAVLTLSSARGRVLRRLPQTGYERVTAGRSLLLVDVGAPPPAPYDAAAHAGLLSFEFSVGRERLIVNCGASPEDDPAWRSALAATAAHSTLTLADTNACEVLPDGGIGHRPDSVTAQRYEQDGVHHVEAMHDGYVGPFRVAHHRVLSLTAEGDELFGREALSGTPGRDFTLRWHLHPSVQASLVQGGQAALLRTPSNSGWRLRVDHGGLSLEPSIYCGDGSPRRSLQLRVSGPTYADPTVIGWALTREKKS